VGGKWARLGQPSAYDLTNTSSLLETVTKNKNLSNIRWEPLVTGKKVKEFQYMPGQAQRIPGGRGSQISRQLAHEVGKVVSPTHRPPLPPTPK